jgi:acyl carrier protein
MLDFDQISALLTGFLSMDETKIYAQLSEVFESVFDDDSIELNPALTAKDVDGWDSLTHIRLLLTVERSFKVKFSTSEIGKLENVGSLVALIQTKLAEKH